MSNDTTKTEPEVTEPEVAPVVHSGRRATTAKDWKGSGQHDEHFAQEGRLYCSRDALLWPCPQSEPGKRLNIQPFQQ